MPDSSLRYRVVFSINEAAPAGEVNRSLEKVARYLNLLAAGGIRTDAGDIVAVVHGPATPIVAINPDNPNLALIRSEDHTSELQSLMRNSYAVFCLKKKKT